MRSDVRLALPSKGRLQQGALEFMARCGFDVKTSATRGYVATIPALPGVTVLFQRPRDIVVSVANGGVDFGITGLDVVQEAGVDASTRVIHDALGFGRCRLVVAVPEQWPTHTLADLRAHAAQAAQPLRVATVFPQLTARFLEKHNIRHSIVEAEGSLEVMPEIGSADYICDIVETGSTLIQNRLRMVSDGVMLNTQSVLVAHRASLQRPEVMRAATLLIEHFEAHLRAQGNVMLWANVRGSGLDEVGRMVTERTSLGGLQGPTISPIFPNPASAAANPGTHWFSVSVVVRRTDLMAAVEQLRGIGGSGVIATPITYIFEEEPDRVAALTAG
jgi:ATP phosphoribosyltransferase